MKLWFEGWNVNAQRRVVTRRNAPSAAIAALPSAINSLAVTGLRGDSAANNLRKQKRGTPHGLQHV
jgi:hypothetical protein